MFVGVEVGIGSLEKMEYSDKKDKVDNEPVEKTE